MDTRKLPKWKKFLKWVHEVDNAIDIKDAIDAGVAKNAKDFHNLLYILKRKDLVDVEQDNGIYHIYTDENEVEEALGGFYDWDDKNGLHFIFNDEDNDEEDSTGNEEDSTIEAYKREIDALIINVGELKKKLQQSENKAEKLRVKLQIANQANSYLEESISKLMAEVESLKKKQDIYVGIDANLKSAYNNVAKAFAILGGAINS